MAERPFERALLDLLFQVDRKELPLGSVGVFESCHSRDCNISVICVQIVCGVPHGVCIFPTASLSEVPIPDAHFRLGYEGETPDYYLLFLHFMFSREIFEEYFDKERQSQFKDIFQTDEDGAIGLLLESLRTAAADKDVPYALAKSQLLEWVHVYVRKDDAKAH